MNKYMLGWVSVLLCTFAFTACEKENIPAPQPEEETVNDWIYKTMTDNYLWYDEIKKEANYDFNKDPEEFFGSLLSDKDGIKWGSSHLYFSYIEKKRTDSKSISEYDPTYGFDYIVHGLQGKDYYYVRVLYILPNSPAAEAGLKRGDLIVGLNGSKDNLKDYSLMDNGNGIELSVGDVTFNSAGAITGTTVNRTVTISAARVTVNNPFLVDSVYQIGGRTIGYLVYNHFSSGPKDSNDGTYDKEMKQIFSDFKAKGVNEFVLDLRYNGGGLVSCARLLASCLAPQKVIAESNVFCKLMYNDKHRKEDYTYAFDKSVSSSNLNLPRLYVLTGQWTASSSEAVINGLKPFMDVVLIGDQTIGKAVGSVTYGEEEDYDWLMHPIILKICNANDEADYSQVGFTPDYEIYEYGAPFIQFYPLGDTNEKLLSIAIALIEGKVNASLPELRSKSESSVLTTVFSSVGRSVPQGLIAPERD